MTTLYESDFTIFDYDNFSFKKLKEVFPDVTIKNMKLSHQSVWKKWKDIHIGVYAQLNQTFWNAPKIESWTNGWNLRNHFWAAYRCHVGAQASPCIGVLLNKKQLQIYLMFQHYKSEKRTSNLSINRYNELLKKVPDWSINRDITQYHMYLNTDFEFKNHLPLSEYLNNDTIWEKFQKKVQDTSFQLGKFYFRENIENSGLEDIETIISQGIQELTELYKNLF